MNNIIANFDQILAFAKGYNLPLSKKRAIVREYLQVKILDCLYQGKHAPGLIFVGGTAIRLLRNLDRFSEDLDFDLFNMNTSQVDNIIEQTGKRLQKENFDITLYRNVTKKRSYYEYRFPDLLFAMGLSKNTSEKLTIKFDFEHLWKKHTRETFLLNRYGFLTNVVTIPPEQLLVQKLVAYISRTETQARDIYDIVFLASREILPDWKFAKRNGYDKDILKNCIQKFRKEKGTFKTLTARLKPFLMDEANARKMEFFIPLVNSMTKSKPQRFEKRY